MKRTYELTVIFSPELTSEQLKKTEKNLEDLIKKYEGSISKREDWGTRELAFPIAKNTKGTYRFFKIDIPGKSLKELDRELKLKSEIIRYLFVREGD